MIPKIYRIIAILMISVCYCISCIQTYECLPISIRNGTDETIHITVFPKGDTTGFCYLYEEVSGGCRVSKFDLLPYYGNESNSENIFSENSTWDFQVGESYEHKSRNISKTISDVITEQFEGYNSFYVVNFREGGWVMISANDATVPNKPVS